MKQNPCRYCALSIVYKQKRFPSYRHECLECEKIKKHKEYLQSQRKFTEGEPITDINELLEQEWVMWFCTIKHIEVIKHTQLSTVLSWLKLGAFRKAIRREDS